MVINLKKKSIDEPCSNLGQGYRYHFLTNVFGKDISVPQSVILAIV